MSINSGSANTNPIFTLWPRVGTAFLTGQNATLSGTPLPQFVISAGMQGSLVTRVEYQSTISASSNMINVFLCDEGGVTGTLWRQYAMTGGGTTGLSATAWSTADALFTPMVLPSGWTIRAGQMTGGTGYLRVYLGDY